MRRHASRQTFDAETKAACPQEIGAVSDKHAPRSMFLWPRPSAPYRRCLWHGCGRLFSFGRVPGALLCIAERAGAVTSLSPLRHLSRCSPWQTAGGPRIQAGLLTGGSGATIRSLRSPALPRNGLLAIFFP
jgi:hypothetical protein